MRSTEIKAFAKINLILNVSGRRPDGFHEVETLMQGISLADEVRISWEELGSAAFGEAGAYGSDLEITLDCGDSSLSCGSDNLAYRAAALMHSEFHSNVTERIDIEIEKRIPVAAGLAGGSADGAAVITGLAKLWGLLPEERPIGSASRAMLEKLCSVAAKLGSDVPFSFMLQSGLTSAVGRGRGTELEPAESRAMDLILLTPDHPVSTKLVYDAFDSLPQQPAGDVGGYLSAKSLEEAVGYCENGLRNAACAVCPGIEPAEEALKKAFPDALLVQLSGSGPTVYAVFESGKGPDARALKEAVLPEGSLNAARAL